MQEEMLISQFQQLYDLIKQARSIAIFSANREHLNLYWQVGAYIDAKLAGGSWGDKVVDQFSEWLNQKDPTIKNFDRRNIYRMRAFFLAYATLEIRKEKDGISIGGSAKPQFENIDQGQDAIVVSAKPQFRIKQRYISPALVAEYQTKLIDKGIHKKNLSEWSENIEYNNE